MKKSPRTKNGATKRADEEEKIIDDYCPVFVHMGLFWWVLDMGKSHFSGCFLCYVLTAVTLALIGAGTLA